MKTKVLDHGFVELLNVSGPVRRNSEDWPHGQFDASDIDPAITARISFDNFEEERTYEQDMKLVEYLIKNHHNTPIEMIETWWHMKMPIFIARQFVRHRTATINEVSGRYTTLPTEWYIPEVVGGKSKNNKQGQEDNLQESVQLEFKLRLQEQCKISYSEYSYAIGNGVAPEHARMFLHLNHYTHWIWKQDLHNLMHFLSLRLDKHAQVEARAFAEAMYNNLKEVLPGLMTLFDKYRRIEDVKI